MIYSINKLKLSIVGVVSEIIRSSRYGKLFVNSKCRENFTIYLQDSEIVD